MNFLSPVFNEQTFDANGDPLVGGKVYTYAAGTSTPLQTYTTQNGVVTHSNPIVLDVRGEPPAPIWLLGSGQEYKFQLHDANDNLIRTIDDVGGINDSGSGVDEWVTSFLTPNYVSATSLSFAGDQTLTLTVGRRIRTTNTGGVIYSTIQTSVFGAGVTTITVINDSGVLDSGVSVIYYGFLSPVNPSAPDSQAFRVSIGLPGYYAHGRCRLAYQSTTALILTPYDGNTIIINGRVVTIPGAGVTLSPTGLNYNTAYYIYAYLLSGVLTLEASTALPLTDSATGVKIKGGDATRTLVGLGLTADNAPGAKLWRDNSTAIGCISYFNRREIVRSSFAGSALTTASPSYANLGLRIDFLTWADEPVKFSVNGAVSNSSAANTYTSIGVDGTSPQDVCNFAFGTNNLPLSISHVNSFSEGYHYSTVLGAVSGGTGSWIGSAVAGSRTTHQAIVMG